MREQLKGCHAPEYSCPVPMPNCAPPKQEKIPFEKQLDLFEEEFCLGCGTQLCHGVRDEEMREGCTKYREMILHEKQENICFSNDDIGAYVMLKEESAKYYDKATRTSNSDSTPKYSPTLGFYMLDFMGRVENVLCKNNPDDETYVQVKVIKNRWGKDSNIITVPATLIEKIICDKTIMD